MKGLYADANPIKAQQYDKYITAIFDLPCLFAFMEPISERLITLQCNDKNYIIACSLRESIDQAKRFFPQLRRGLEVVKIIDKNYLFYFASEKGLDGLIIDPAMIRNNNSLDLKGLILDRVMCREAIAEHNILEKNENEKRNEELFGKDIWKKLMKDEPVTDLEKFKEGLITNEGNK